MGHLQDCGKKRQHVGQRLRVAPMSGHKNSCDLRDVGGDHSSSTNVVQLVLEPETLLDHAVALIQQVASTVFNLLLKIGDLGSEGLDVGLCLLAIKIAPQVGGQPRGTAPLLELRRHPTELRIFPEGGVPVAELAVQQALEVPGLAITPVAEDGMGATQHQTLR